MTGVSHYDRSAYGAFSRPSSVYSRHTGDTAPLLRTTLTQQATSFYVSVPQDEGSISSEIETYVKKVALHAYQVTDQDIEQLRKSGYSEDAIFEITLSVALGASMNCLTQGLKAIDGAEHALEEH